MICRQCGDEFELQTRRGKPRIKCYECNPLRPAQKRRKQAVQPRKPVTVADVKANPHCPQCGAYLDANSVAFPFCSPQHRTAFAERVRREAERKQLQHRSGRLGPDCDPRGSVSDGAIRRRTSREKVSA